MGAPSVRQGDVLAGRYRVDREIGSGAMGFVVAATDVQQNVKRAIKLMRSSALGDRVAVTRFLREARACLKLQGEHHARVYELGRLPDGAPFMVMELLEGRDLRAELEARGALPLAEAMVIVLQVCEALAEAHRNGIVHRDLKPANVFLVKRADRAIHVKVLDFGVSKILGDAGSSGDTTRSNVMLGSPHYMSPEQMRNSREVDARTDVWSLGVVAYQILTGRVPFEGKGLTQIITAVIEGRPDPPSHVVKGLPPALDAVILHCLVSEPDERCRQRGRARRGARALRSARGGGLAGAAPRRAARAARGLAGGGGRRGSPRWSSSPSRSRWGAASRSCSTAYGDRPPSPVRARVSARGHSLTPALAARSRSMVACSAAPLTLISVRSSMMSGLPTFSVIQAVRLTPTESGSASGVRPAWRSTSHILTRAAVKASRSSGLGPLASGMIRQAVSEKSGTRRNARWRMTLRHRGPGRLGCKFVPRPPGACGIRPAERR